MIKSHRVGVIYQKNGQERIEEIISNCEEDCLPSYFSFLNLLGKRISNSEQILNNLEGNDDHFDLIYSNWRDLDLLFIVSTLLPYDSFDLEQVLFHHLILY